jgi:hypothetical protein
VAREGQGQFVAGDPRSVIAHPDQLTAALLNLDLDTARAGVEAILNELLYNRGGPLHHLSVGDLIDELYRQSANRHGKRVLKKSPCHDMGIEHVKTEFVPIVPLKC